MRGSRVPKDASLSNEMRAFLDGLDRKVPNHNLTATAPPTANDDGDAGYGLGSLWIVNGATIYMCADAATGAAVWPQLN